jgi:hypothetical protein
LNARSVYISIPAYGGQVHARFAQSLLELSHRLDTARVGWELAWLTGESHVGRARNTSLSQYLLLSGPSVPGAFQFLDTDLDFCAATLAEHLVACLDGVCPTDSLLGGSYPTKRLYHGDLERAVKAGASGADALLAATRHTLRFFGGATDPSQQGVVEQERLVETLYTPGFTWARVMWLPTGLLTVPRKCAEQLAEQFKDRTYLTDGGEERWDLFPTLPHRLGGPESAPILLSEDYAFCQLAAQAGIQSWANMNLGAAHIGSFTYGKAY